MRSEELLDEHERNFVAMLRRGAESPETEMWPTSRAIITKLIKDMDDGEKLIRQWFKDMDMPGPDVPVNTMVAYAYGLKAKLEETQRELVSARAASAIFEVGSAENAKVFEVLLAAKLIPPGKPGTALSDIVRDLLAAPRNGYPVPEDVWSEDQGHSRATWRCEVSEGNTNLSYWEWVMHQKEAEEGETRAGSG